MKPIESTREVIKNIGSVVLYDGVTCDNETRPMWAACDENGGWLTLHNTKDGAKASLSYIERIYRNAPTFCSSSTLRPLDSESLHRDRKIS